MTNLDIDPEENSSVSESSSHDHRRQSNSDSIPIESRESSAGVQKRPERGETKGQLQFVNYDAGQRPKSPGTRKAIREHVMREFHSRRRQEKAALFARTNNRRPILQNAVQSAESSTSNTTAAGQNSSLTDESAQPPSVFYNTLNFHESNEISLDCSQNGPSSKVKRPITPKQSQSLNDEVSFDNWPFDINTPYAILLTDGAPDLVMESRRWPFIQRISSSRPGISIWMPDANIPNTNVHDTRPCLLKNMGTVPWISNSVEYLKFKVEAIKWINERLGQGQLATSDNTIGVIMCITGWEIVRGDSDELQHHLEGLDRIVNLRGGLESIKEEKLFRYKLAFLDLLSFTIYGTPLHLSLCIPQSEATPSYGPSQAPLFDSPLYGDHHLGILLESSPFPPNTISRLRFMRDLIILEEDGSMKVFSEEGLSEHILEFSSTPAPETLSYPSSTLALATTIQLAGLIYSRALLTPPIPFSSPLNEIPMNNLLRCLESPMNDETWNRFPGLMLWILLTAAAAADQRPEKGFLIMFLVKVGLTVGIRLGAWEAVRVSMMRFAWIRQRAESGIPS